MLDFPGKISAILFYRGCNIRCPYCYNAELIEGEKVIIGDDKVKSFLEKRKGKLDAVVFSGGECTVWKDELYDDIAYVKSMGYAVKVDTNGTNPELIKRLIDDGLIDYVAMDLKCPNDNKFFDIFTYSKTNYGKTLETLDILKNSGVNYEVRTTVHPDITNEKDINNIISYLKNFGYKGKYFIQFYFDVPHTLREVNHKPRRFRTEDLIDASPDIKVEFRNEMDNISRHNE